MNPGSNPPLASSKEIKNTLNSLFFSYNVGYNYFSLLFPAMAVLFSYNHTVVKLVYALYFLVSLCLLSMPGLLVYRLGFRKACIIYCISFIFGTGLCGFSNGVMSWVVWGRVFQAFGISVIPFFTKVLIFQLPKSSIKKSIVERVIISNLSGPFFILALGVLIRVFSWKVAFDVVGGIFSLMLIKLCFFSHEIKLDGLIPPIKQVREAVRIFRHYRVIAFIMVILLAVYLGSFVSMVYAYVLHVEFNLPITLVACFPIAMSIISLISTGFTALLSKYVPKKYDFVMAIAALLINLAVAIIYLLLYCLSIRAWWIYVVVSGVWIFIETLLYIYLSDYLGVLLKSLNKNIDVNIVYFWLRSVISLVSLLVWSCYESSDFILPVVSIALTILPLILLFFIPWGQLKPIKSSGT